jgi:hypothetical protein
LEAGDEGPSSVPANRGRSTADAVRSRRGRHQAPQPTDQDRLAVGNEESARAGLEPVTPTLPTLDEARTAYLEAIDRLGEKLKPMTNLLSGVP